MSELGFMGRMGLVGIVQTDVKDVE